MLTYLRTVIAVNAKAFKDEGASAVEYGLLVAAIAAVIVGVVFGLGTLLQTAFSDTSTCIANKGC